QTCALPISVGPEMVPGRGACCQRLPTRRTPMRVIETRLSRRTFVATGLASGFSLARRVVPAQSQNRSLKMETTIRVDSGITTLINIFTVEPENREQLSELLKEGTETWISTLAGFISANFHNSKDRRRVIIYGQWRRAKDIEA